MKREQKEILEAAYNYIIRRYDEFGAHKIVEEAMEIFRIADMTDRLRLEHTNGFIIYVIEDEEYCVYIDTEEETVVIEFYNKYPKLHTIGRARLDYQMNYDIDYEANRYYKFLINMQE